MSGDPRASTLRDRDLLEAARAGEARGEPGRALGLLLQISTRSRLYREALSHTSRLVWDHELNLTPELEAFVDPFVCGELGRKLGDAPTLYGLGRLFERLDLRTRASVAYRATLDLVPGFLDTERRLEGLALADADAQRWEQLHRSGEVARRLGPSASTTFELSVDLPDEAATSTVADRLTERVAEHSQRLGMGLIGPGIVVGGRYVLERAIGEGGYAIVYEALDIVTERPVALKLFRQNRSDPVGLARFRAEMRITQRLDHPNIVKTLEVGAWRSAYFIALDLLKGMDLRDWMSGAEPRSPGEITALLEQALEGLAVAHSRGIVHRDIKPRNLFVLKGGHLKVMDFGLATAADVTGDWTKTGRIVGTPAFVAPERLRPSIGPVGPATDVYSMGVVFFEALTGSLPFVAQKLSTLFRKILDSPPPRPGLLNQDVPKDLERIVLKMLSKRPEDRFATCEEVLVALRSR